MEVVMAKSYLRLRARELRKQGISVKEIARSVGASKSSASLWTKDIILSVDQLEQLKKKALKGAERGRLVNSLRQKEARLKRIEAARLVGVQEFEHLSARELLVTGLAIYAGEGNKKTRAVRFCNSDPKIIKFMIHWYKECFGVFSDRLSCFVGINEVHRSREYVVKQYWSELTGIPLSSFTKSSFKKVTNTKVYDNFNDHYGSLDVRVLRPGELYYKIIGLIDGLFTGSSQGSSAVAAHAS